MANRGNLIPASSFPYDLFYLAYSGAAMFVQCIVASEVIRISQGAPCRGATMRDVATYTISLIGVALSFAYGTVRKGSLTAVGRL